MVDCRYFKIKGIKNDEECVFKKSLRIINESLEMHLVVLEFLTLLKILGVLKVLKKVYLKSIQKYSKTSKNIEKLKRVKKIEKYKNKNQQSFPLRQFVF